MAMDSLRMVLFVFLATGFLSSGYAVGPNITSLGTERELIINATDDIDLTCGSNWPINWKAQSLQNSTVEINSTIREHSRFRYVSRLYVPQAQHFHTGYYKCYDETNDTIADTVYIYVKDNNYPFVQKDDGLIYLPVHQYHTAVFDCRPNSPDIEVKLESASEEQLTLGENPEDGTVLEYDPKIGFTMQYVNNRQGGLYNCVVGDNRLMILLQILMVPDNCQHCSY